MQVRTRDLGFIMAVAVLLLVLILNSLRDKPKGTPLNDVHRPLYEAMSRGDKREQVEKECVGCHTAASRPLPPKHPPKEQCLICHRLQQAH